MGWKEQKTGPKTKSPVFFPAPPPWNGPAKAPAPAVATLPLPVAAGLATVFASVAAGLTMTATAIQTLNMSASGGGGVVPESERDETGMRMSETGSASGRHGGAEMIFRTGSRIRGHGVGKIERVVAAAVVVVQGTYADQTIRGERAAMLMLIGSTGRDCTDTNMQTRDDDVVRWGLRKGARGIGQ